jgi:two-component system response regulator PilR (NtrC family)
VRLCGEGLRLAGRSRALSTLEVALNLHATKGSAALRTFDLDGAVRDFETSLEIAESIGSPANQALILNNLGIAYGQSDRYADAIRAFSDAEKTCLRLDEGPSLASIYSNLAILHSKRGRFEEAEKALEEGERLGRAAIGRRQELFLKHARGLSLVSRGRYAQARTHLEEAIRLGEALGDPHITTFDRLYRAEALLFEGSYTEASSELSRLSEPSRPPAVRQGALARQALLLSLMGGGDRVKAAAADHDAVEIDRALPFLEAWNRLFLAWAFSISGIWEEARARLDLAAKFFTLHQLAPGVAMVLCVKAEGLLLAGRAAEAREIVEREEAGGSDLASTIHSLLLARLLLELGRGSEDRARCADSLARAGALLVGNPLPEWSARHSALRAALLPEEDARPEKAEGERREISLRLPPEGREAFLQSRYWLLWTKGIRPSPIVRRGRQGKRPPPREPGPSNERGSGSGSNTTLLGRKGGLPLRQSLVASSPAMRRLVAMLDRIRRSELPVLILGETGSGKELMARLIHAESRRSAGPFRVVDCAAIPGGLLESEIFGARAGAFTDLTRDRKGILEDAAGGTVFIDEIAGAPFEAQAKLLRVISEKSCRPLGSDSEVRVDARFLFSSSRDLEAEARQGRLRPDLLHRLQVLTLQVPPLRERPEDFRGLVERFLREGGGEPSLLGEGALEHLRELPWPGNVRELRNFIARLRVECPEGISGEAVDRARGDPETSTIFPRNVLSKSGLPALKDRLEREYFVHHFRRLGGDTDALCRFLGLSRQQLYRTCARLGIQLRGERRKKGLREAKRRNCS